MPNDLNGIFLGITKISYPKINDYIEETDAAILYYKTITTQIPVICVHDMTVMSS